MMKKLVFILVSALLLPPSLRAQFILAGKGQEPAKLVVSEKNAKELKPAAMWLKKYCRQITGEKLKIVPSASGKRVEFVLDPKMPKDSFSVTFPEKGVMRLTGSTPRSVQYAALDLLERYAGCRWLYMGKLGDEVPKADIIEFPTQDYKDAPAFLDRTFSFSWNTPNIGRYGDDWIVKVRLSPIEERVRFKHNLDKLFPPKIFGKSHPEFYQILHGKRFDVLAPKSTYRWQPCFSAPGIAEAAAKRIIEHFRKTGERTYSLGVNDIETYCECEQCEKTDGNVINYLGVRNRTASYFKFCNEVARLVTAEYPDAKLGFLAYECMNEPLPGFKLHPALVPFITYDRMQWLIPERRELDQKITRSWKATGLKEIGWYDYIYGGHYQLPRMYLHLMQQYLQWAHKNGVRRFYSEFHPSDDAHEGPKGYAFMKMLWNPYLDLDKLLDDWYVKAVGPKAAPYLREYFDRIEDFWTKRAWKDCPFFKPSLILNFNSNDYLQNYTAAELDRSAELLDKMVELADNKARAEHFRQTFRSREKSLRSYVRNEEVKKNVAKLDFSSVLLKDSFDNGLPGSWQSRKGKFYHDPNSGIGNTPCAVLDFDGSLSATMTFLAYPPMKGCEYFKASIRYKAVDFPKSGGSEYTGAKARITFSIRWQGSVASDPYSPKIDWLHDSTGSFLNEKVNRDGEWHTLTVYCRKPLVPTKRMVVLFGANRGFKGKICFDDLEVLGAKAGAQEKAK